MKFYTAEVALYPITYIRQSILFTWLLLFAQFEDNSLEGAQVQPPKKER